MATHAPVSIENRPVILVAEDEVLVAFDLAETVEVSGYAVDGPYPTVSDACQAVSAHRPDCALLDVHLLDEEVYPLADQLIKAHVPIVFHSGHASAADLLERYPHATVCQKPCPPDQLMEALRDAVVSAEAA